MRILTEIQRQRIIEFIDGDILPEELTAVLGPVPHDTPTLLIALLESAVASGDAKDAEGAFGLIHSFKEELGKKAVPILIVLLQMEGHYWHEDIVSTLQGIKDARAVNVLFDTALSIQDYLDYDDYAGLARKCTWALADIGSEEAYCRLQSLAANSNRHIAHYAQKRIDSWENEQGRKAFHFFPGA